MIESSLGNRTTWGETLEKYMRKNFPSISFRGVFSNDNFPNNLKNGDSMLINTDSSKGQGIHWTAVFKSQKHGWIGYDSFGRKMSKIIPLLIKHNIVDSNQDKDQDLKNTIETNCGQRSLAWIVLASQDIESALLI